MDDAVVDSVCAARGVSFGSVRHISDPAQNVALPVEAQAAWGGAVYRAYGIFTSYNGALATAAMLAAS